jgi:RimJ/RimL family protein N-acetyltransferase
VRNISLSERYVHLRPIVPGDYQRIYDWTKVPGVGDCWRYHSAAPPPHRFIETLFQGLLEHCVIVKPSTAEPIGLVSAYNPDLRSGTCFVSLMSAPEWLSRGVTVVGAGAFIDRMFLDWPMRKIYLEVFSYNLSRLGRIAPRIGRLEATFKEDLLWNGEWHDRLIYAVDRQSWCREWRDVIHGPTSNLVAKMREIALKAAQPDDGQKRS